MPVAANNQKRPVRRVVLHRGGRWRSLVPRVLIALAVLSVAYSVYDCHRDRQVSTWTRDAHLEAFLQQLGSGEVAVVVAAARALGESGYARAIEPLRAKLQDGSPEVAGAASAALGRLGDQDSAEALLGLLGREEVPIVEGAATGLGALRSRKAVEPLTRLLSLDDFSARLAVIQALGEIGDPAPLAELEKRHEELASGGDTALSEEERDAETKALSEAIQALRKGG